MWIEINDLECSASMTLSKICGTYFEIDEIQWWISFMDYVYGTMTSQSLLGFSGIHILYFVFFLSNPTTKTYIKIYSFDGKMAKAENRKPSHVKQHGEN